MRISEIFELGGFGRGDGDRGGHRGHRNHGGYWDYRNHRDYGDHGSFRRYSGYRRGGYCDGRGGY